MTLTISRTDLARRTREIVEQVQHGQAAIVKSYGEEQIVLLDIVDYRILCALGGYVTRAGKSSDASDFDRAIWDYLDEEINLGRAANLMGMSRFELMERFHRLGVPLRMGPSSVDEAQDEIEVARRHRPTA